MNNNKFFDKLPDTFIIFDTQKESAAGVSEFKWD